MEQISILDLPGIRIGQVEDAGAGTGATVILCPEGMAASVDVRGGGPASRDSRILDPLAAAERIHAVLLAGGSAFGLDAAGGVQRYLEEHGFGLDMGMVKVPLVCQSDIFDLGVGNSAVRPDQAMGYAACVAAERNNYQDGNFGVGCGATVGKILGPEFAMKTGVGSYAVQLGPLQVGAIMVVNAVGDVYDPDTGMQIAGLLSEDKRTLRSTTDVLYAMYASEVSKMGFADAGADTNTDAGADGGAGADTDTDTQPLAANTTIGAVITNAGLSKAELCKMAIMAHDGMARAIRPVHTTMDGDSIYGLSVGDVPAPLDLVGTMAAEVVAKAIQVAVRSAAPAYGMPSYQSLEQNA